MKHIYSGNINSLSALVDRINNRSIIRFFTTNEITHAKLKKDTIVLSGKICKAIGQLDEHKDSIHIDLKVRLRREFVFFGLLVLIILSGFIWGENVTINGDSNPTLSQRIEIVAIGLIVFLAIPSFILRQVRNDFKRKVEKLIK
ncbi:MAG: hypothetical protein ACWA41_00385 [Putridiphycobacter sp.]